MFRIIYGTIILIFRLFVLLVDHVQFMPVCFLFPSLQHSLHVLTSWDVYPLFVPAVRPLAMSSFLNVTPRYVFLSFMDSALRCSSSISYFVLCIVVFLHLMVCCKTLLVGLLTFTLWECLKPFSKNVFNFTVCQLPF